MTNTEKINWKKLFIKTVLIIWVSLFLIPFILIVTLSLGQLRSIAIEGKGDTGYERSLSHPFICVTGNFTGPLTEFYCDYDTFIQKNYKFFIFFFDITGIGNFYIIVLFFLIPSTIISLTLKSEGS